MYDIENITKVIINEIFNRKPLQKILNTFNYLNI